MRILNHSFHGTEEGEVYHRYSLEDEKEVKLIAKMFRELLHIKPPRGRPGRQLPQDIGLCVETVVTKQHYYYDVHQKQVPDELERIENRKRGRSDLGGRFLCPDYLLDNEGDLERLRFIHQIYSKKQEIQGVSRNLDELINGLMGRGVKNVHTSLQYGNKWETTMELDGYFITIQEVR